MKKQEQMTRARFCYDHVAGWDSNWKDKAKARVEGLPVELRSQGLLVTLATLMSEGDEGSRVSQALALWLLKDSPHKLFGTRDKGSAKDLLEACLQADRATYAAAQKEALILVGQIKVYANALYKNTKGGKG